MDVRLIRRPLAEIISGRTQGFQLFNATCRRHESSYRRTKKRLNIGPDSSFLNANGSLQHDHVIFNPPSSAPSTLHTPLKFLPKQDKRRELLAATAAKTDNLLTELPPPIYNNPNHQKHHLSEVEILEIRRLRTVDPEKWSARKLGLKFNCASRFVAWVCEAPKEKQELHWAKKKAARDQWGPRRTAAREDRGKRMQLASRGE